MSFFCFCRKKVSVGFIRKALELSGKCWNYPESFLGPHFPDNSNPPVARKGHGVIVQQGQFIVIGGANGPLGTERCSLVNDSIQCTTVDPELENYNHYPEMMHVSEDFCQK